MRAIKKMKQNFTNEPNSKCRALTSLNRARFRLLCVDAKMASLGKGGKGLNRAGIDDSGQLDSLVPGRRK